jgi:hypothetical protein
MNLNAVFIFSKKSPLFFFCVAFQADILFFEKKYGKKQSQKMRPLEKFDYQRISKKLKLNQNQISQTVFFVIYLNHNFLFLPVDSNFILGILFLYSHRN